MKRELFDVKRGKMVNWCCPGHDDWPDETYRNRRSKKARSLDKKREHRYVRHVKKYIIGEENDND